MRLIYIILLMSVCIDAWSQNPVQNCMGAIPICQTSYTQNNSYSGAGSQSELNVTNQGCLTTGESNSVWYILNTATAGSLVFTITPGTPTSDYDFAVWDLTDKSCNAISNGLQPIRCNYASLINSSPAGLTGLSTSSLQPSIGAGGGSFSSSINAAAGQTFVILINNSSGSPAGYNINFSGSTCQIQDNIAPTIKSDTISASCTGPSSVKILLSENIICTSFAPNGSDFVLTPSTSTISSAISNSCGSGGTYTNLFTLNFSSPLTPGTYSISVTNGTDGNTLIDNCGNAMLAGTSISFTVLPSLQIAISTQLGCAGTPSGAITATNIGGTPPFTYKLNSGAFVSNNIFSGLWPGVYTVTVKDFNGCLKDSVVNLIQGPVIQINSVTVTNPLCYGVNSGSVVVNATGGTPPLSYSINSSPYSSNNTISNVAPGNHFIHIKDANGCIKDTLIFISSPGQISINSATIVNASCGLNNGSIQISAFGGVFPLSFSLNNSAYQSLPNFSNLSSGLYTLSIKDANNCLKDTTINILLIPPVAISSLNTIQPSCAGNSGSITINGNGGTFPFTYSINGITFTTLNNFSSLSSGTFTVTIKDATGCLATSVATLTSPSNLSIGSSTVILPSCTIQGSITVSGTGGVPPYLFALNTGTYASSNTFSPLVPGTFVVHIKDNNGCIHDTTIVLSGALLPIIDSLNIVNPTCSFPSSGSIDIIASGGILPYSYSLNGSAFANNSLFSGLSGGIYNVIIKDANGCTSSSSLNITSSNTIAFSPFSHTNIGCSGNPLGSISATLVSGNAPYEYSLNGAPFQLSGNYTGLNAGTYTIVAKDASECSISSIVVITTAANLTINNISVINSTCFAPATGSILISGNSSATPITYSLNNSVLNNSGIYNTLAPGTYTVGVHDNNGCQKDSVITITGQPPLYFTNPNIIIPPCYGGIGSISIQGGGGSAPYTFSLNNAPFTSTSAWPSLPAGSYNIQLMDGNGCTHDTNIILFQPPQISISGILITNASCSGAASGSISITSNTGLSPFLYSLNNGPFGNNSSFSGLVAGTYVIHILDSIGCGKDTTISINNGGNFAINSIFENQPNCFDDANGDITFNVMGGTSPYEYAINSSPFSSNNQFQFLSSGNYTLHAKDNGGCFTDSVFHLSQPGLLGFSSLVITPSSCYDNNTGKLICYPQGGTPSYLYKLDSGTFGTSQTYYNLSADIHTISIIDAHGCVSDSLFEIFEPAPLHFNNVFVMNPGCMGNAGMINVDGIGGTTPYLFSIGNNPFTTSGTFNNLPSGTYTLHIKDNAGCETDTVILIEMTQVINLNSVTSAPLLCPSSNNGFINVSANSVNLPIEYTLNGGPIQNTGNFASLTPGIYTIHAEDQVGCFVDSIIILPIAPPIQINNINFISPLCNASADGSIELNAIGGAGSLAFSIDLFPYSANNLFTNLTAGTYTLHTRDSLLCNVDTIVQLTSPSPITFSSITIVNPYCSIATDGKITINASGGQPPYLYAINTSLYTTNNLFQNLFQGNYTVHVQDYNGCIHDTIIYLSSANYMTFPNATVTDVTCKYGNDGSISLSVTGGFAPYQFSNNSIPSGSSGLFGNLGSGIYSITVTDLFGCQKDTVITIHEPTTPATGIILNVTPNLCRGDSIGTITASGTGGTAPYSFSINGSPFQTSSIFTGLSADVYTITIKDQNGCKDDTLANVIEPDTSVQLFLIHLKDVSCLNVNDGELEVTSKYGTQPLLFYFNGNAVGIDTFYKNLIPGDYFVEVKDSLGCKSTGKFSIRPSDRRPYILIDSIHGVICAGDKDGAIDWHAINTFPPYYYTFDSLFIGQNSFMDGISNGSYFIQVTDSVGCYADTVVDVIALDSLEVKVLASPALCQGIGDDGKAIAFVHGGNEPFIFTWSDDIGNYTDHSENLWYGEHVLNVKDNLGCADTANFTIEYDPCCKVSLPNAFSPNNDGKNDVFKVIRFGEITLVSFSVYNRWGNQVFSSITPGNGWDGKYKGEECEVGTYFYLLEYRCHLKNETIMLKGDVTLLR